MNLNEKIEENFLFFLKKINKDKMSGKNKTLTPEEVLKKHQEMLDKKKIYYQANKDKKKAYYEANKDEIINRQKAYYESNKEKILVKQRERYLKNKALVDDAKKSKTIIA